MPIVVHTCYSETVRRKRLPVSETPVPETIVPQAIVEQARQFRPETVVLADPKAAALARVSRLGRGREGRCTERFVAMFANFSHGGIASDHRHDSFIQVVERLLWLSSYYCRNIFCTPFA